MLPQKIKEFIIEVKDATDNHKIEWKFDVDSTLVKGTYNSNHIEIYYRFDEINDTGVYLLEITDKNGKFGKFSGTHGERDYETLKDLFDMAQACELDFG